MLLYGADDSDVPARVNFRIFNQKIWTREAKFSLLMFALRNNWSLTYFHETQESYLKNIINFVDNIVHITD